MKHFYLFLLASIANLDVHAECYQEIKQKLPNSGTILFGEIHGTNEIPEFFFDCVVEFAKNHEDVNIFLEFPISENSQVTRYLKGEIDSAELTKAQHWKGKDGRSSVAILKILESVKIQPFSHKRLYGFDKTPAQGERERAMVENFKLNHSSTSYNFVLTGNRHARLTLGSGNDAQFMSFGYLLKKDLPNVISLIARFPAGTAWVCTPKCGELSINGNDSTTNEKYSPVMFFGDSQAYSGYFRVKRLSASRPIFE